MIKEEKYIPILALNKKESDIRNISLYGYPYFLNQKKVENEKRSSFFMTNMYGSEG